ncbi:MAG: hypothetical protein U9O55_01560 [Patescibacteria group bacterium]|nr:hypothetical protein [Patescibacteria group bacterium]
MAKKFCIILGAVLIIIILAIVLKFALINNMRYVISDIKNNNINSDKIDLNNIDSDNDGLVDSEEIKLGTDILNPDTDGDGYLDGEEVKKINAPLAKGIIKNYDPLIKDSDLDGISDEDEIKLGIDPYCVDTDGDGLVDSEEIKLGTDPLNIDTDGDGIIDGADGGKFFKTDPLNPDTDGDGYLDGEEIRMGYDPTKKNSHMPAGPPPGSAN